MNSYKKGTEYQTMFDLRTAICPPFSAAAWLCFGVEPDVSLSQMLGRSAATSTRERNDEAFHLSGFERSLMASSPSTR